MARGYTFKRCTHGITGTPARGSKPAVPACRVRHGSWNWRAEGARDPETGRRTQPGKGGFATRDEAQEALTAYLAETGGGRELDDRRMTLAQWMRRWLAAGIRDGIWEPVTAARYASHVELVAAHPIGKVRLRDLRRWHIEQFIADLGRPGASARARSAEGRRAASTLDLVRRTIRSSLSTAKRHGRVRENVAQGRIDAIGKIQRPDVRWWEPEHLRAFLDCPQVAGDPLSSMWAVAAFTGLRRAELCGLRWADVHLDDPWPGVDITQRCVTLSGPQRCPVCSSEHRGRLIRPRTKTDAGVRWVPLATEAADALRVHASAMAEHRRRWPDVFVEHDLVWCEPDGAPLAPSHVTKRHAALVSAAGQPRVTLHEMRHGAISLLANSGMPAHLIAIIAGHGSKVITERIYIHGMKGPLAEHMQAGADLVRAGSAQNARSEVTGGGHDAV